MQPDVFKGLVLKWWELLGLTGRLYIDTDYYFLGLLKVLPVVIQFNLTHEPSEVEIAIEIGRLALGQRLDTCFAMPVFEGRDNQDTPSALQFIDQTTISQLVSHLLAIDIVVPFSDEIAADMIAANSNCLREIAQLPNAWMDMDDLEINALLQEVAISASALERMGVLDWQNGERFLNKIASDIHWSLGDEGVDKVDGLRALYRDIAELPTNLEKALGLFERTTKKAARILGHAVPRLECSQLFKWHYWTKVEKLELTEAEKHGVL
jgi:hypothetical protein